MDQTSQESVCPMNTFRDTYHGVGALLVIYYGVECTETGQHHWRVHTKLSFVSIWRRSCFEHGAHTARTDPFTLEAHSPQRARTPRSRQARPHPWKRLEPQLRWWGRENYEKDRRAARPHRAQLSTIQRYCLYHEAVPECGEEDRSIAKQIRPAHASRTLFRCTLEMAVPTWLGGYRAHNKEGFHADNTIALDTIPLRR